MIHLNGKKFLAFSESQQVTVIFHELWHHKEGLTKLFPKLDEFVTKNTALGKFFSEGMAVFNGSWKVLPSLKKGWEYVDPEKNGLTKPGLFIQGAGTVGAVSSIIAALYSEYTELFDED